MFAKTAIESIQIPSTLRHISRCTFNFCKNLKNVTFAGPSRLEKISFGAFLESGIERIELPRSVKSIGVGAFLKCKHLRDVRLNEGLEKLGEKETQGGHEVEGEVFA